jgi:CRISPR-associated protein Csx10
MHVGISRATGSALHSLLFSYEMLVEEKLGKKKDEEIKPLKFVGTLSANDQSALEELAKVVPEREHLSVGHARTRGLGELSIEQRTPLANKNDLETRCRAFNNAVHAKGGDAKVFYFSITLNSHLALRDRLSMPVLADLNAQHFGLHEQEMLPAGRLKPIVAFLSATVVPGWNAALGLPKPDTHAISRGSVVVFALPKDAVTSTLMNRLATLECEGVGERRAEGFGSLTVCHPIHYNFFRKN